MLLKETACHTISPRGFEECPERSQGERVSPHHHALMLPTCCSGGTVKTNVSSLQAVVANCSVLITVKDNNATVTKYNCVTRQGQLVFCFLTPVYRDAFAIQAFVCLVWDVTSKIYSARICWLWDVEFPNFKKSPGHFVRVNSHFLCSSPGPALTRSGQRSEPFRAGISGKSQRSIELFTK